MPKRIAVFIDGMNMRSSLRRLGWEEFADIRRLGSRLAGNNILVSCDYCIGEPHPGLLGTTQYQTERAYYEAIQSPPLIRVHFGRIERRPWGYVEKEVDVLVAAQMISKAARDGFDTAFLVSADSDLVPAVKAVQSFDKTVLPLIFPKPRGIPWTEWGYNHELWKHCDKPLINANKAGMVMLLTGTRHFRH